LEVEMIRAVAVLAMLLGTAAVVQGQGVVISGNVVDETGAVVPGATVVLAGPTRQTTVSGTMGDYTFQNVASGTYDITVSLVGFAQQTTRGVVAGTSNVRVPPIELTVAAIGETVVVSAARLESALVDAPATMSVLTEEVLASTPAQNYGDLLRSVPGVNAIQLSARDVNLTNRQATTTLSNSQLVLLDGRSIYLDFFGLVLWDYLPNNMSDVKQIEVIRGPASAVWGANALTGVVSIITKSPREAPGTTVSLSGGLFGRDAGSTEGRGVGGLFGANATVANIVNDTWSYRVSAGYFNSEPFPRPTGQIPVIPDPRGTGGTVGGAMYPADETGPIGTAFENRGTSQPKFDLRFDQELATGGRLTYQGGVAGTEGIIYTGLGPFDIQSGSYMGYGKVNYSKEGLRLSFFTNFVEAVAPNLLLLDPSTGGPLQLDFPNQTYDFEAGHALPLGQRQVISVGGNARRTNFDLTIAPAAQDRNEFGAYLQDQILLDRFRFTVGARVDKFGNLADPVFSPRLAAVVKATEAHSFRVSYNKAFRSPSAVNNYIDTSIVVPTDLRAVAPLLPPPLQPLVASPFPLVVRAVGSELPIGSMAQEELDEESLTAYEVAYTGNLAGRTTVGVSFYVNDLDKSINFTQLPSNLDPYTPSNPPPGWQLPPAILGALAQQGIFLPRTAFTYLNLGPIRQKGLELSLDHRIGTGLSGFANYSWQGDPTILDDPDPYPASELALPPKHRFNIGMNYDGPEYLGSGQVSYSDKAFWSDVLTSQYHGFSDSYTLVNGTFGRKWQGGRITTLIKVNNILDQEVQQHVFGDLLKRSAVLEVRFTM
jgi:outer membrane receptor protein involved in Fe transport